MEYYQLKYSFTPQGLNKEQTDYLFCESERLINVNDALKLLNDNIDRNDKFEPTLIINRITKEAYDSKDIGRKYQIT
jgi:hypothetical protein